MISSIRLVNFKNFEDETLRLGPFTLIVGQNASGKSNVRDAFRFLNGISRSFALPEVVGGKDNSGWQPIRGTANEIMRFGHDEFSLEVEIQTSRIPKINDAEFRYLIRIKRDETLGGQFRVTRESLVSVPKPASSSSETKIYSSHPVKDSSSLAKGDKAELLVCLSAGDPIRVTSNQPILGQSDPFRINSLMVDEVESQSVEWTESDRTKAIANLIRLATTLEFVTMSFLEFIPEVLRNPSLPGASTLGNSGENLPTVLEAICADPQRKNSLLSWLHELTPMDVSDLEFPVDFNGRVNLRIIEANGQKVSAYSASDGTLRFLGMLAALLDEDSSGLYFFEEIDNGIHPARLHLLLDLIERQTAEGKIQVVATTHSPDVLNLISDTTFKSAVVVYRDEDSTNAVIRRVAELPKARELRKSQGLGRLHAGGWMENILSFEQADSEDQKGAE